MPNAPRELSVARAVRARAPTPATRGMCAPGRTRTCNLLIRSQVLYPLSYGRNYGPTRASVEVYPVWPGDLYAAEAPGFEPGMGG